jgi:hypothetical protein
MPRYRLTDMDFDEVSTVDKPANQYSRIVLAKRFQEDGMTEPEYEAPELYDDEGNAVDAASLDPELVIQDEEGYFWHSDGERLVPVYEDEIEREPEMAEVGKSSAFLDNAGTAPSATEQVLKSLSVELSKALDDEQRTAVVSKAVQGLVEENTQLTKRVSDFEQIAKREREIRLEREYIAKADSYGMPIDSQVLGPVLMRMAETMSYDDQAVIDKALTASGEIYREVGLGGEADVNDPFAQIEEYVADAGTQLAKRDGRTGISKEQATRDFFDANPDAYNEYRREQARS